MRKYSMYLWLLATVTICFAARTANSPTWKTGVALYSFNNISFNEAMEKVDSGKIKYVEGFSFYKLGQEYDDHTMGSLSKSEIAKMKARLKKNQVKMVSMYIGGGKDVAEWKQNFEIAKAFGLEFITSEPLKEQWDLIDSLAGIYKIKVAIHNHWKGTSIYWHPDSVLAAIKNHPNFGACADIGHWVKSGLDPATSLKALNGHILALHMKDVDRVGAGEATEDVTVGTGVIDFTKVRAELMRQHYKGMIYMECEHNYGQNLADIVTGITYFNKTLDK